MRRYTGPDVLPYIFYIYIPSYSLASFLILYNILLLLLDSLYFRVFVCYMRLYSRVPFFIANNSFILFVSFISRVSRLMISVMCNERETTRAGRQFFSIAIVKVVQSDNTCSATSLQAARNLHMHFSMKNNNQQTFCYVPVQISHHEPRLINQDL
jgi:hypothetical protein